MAEFQQITLTNTFSQWVTTTQRLVGYTNYLLVDPIWDNGTSTLYSNTNISVGNNVTVLGDVTITGTLVLDETNYNDLYVAGNLSVGETLIADGLNTSNLIVSNNLGITSTNLSVGIVEVQNSVSVDGNYTRSASFLNVTNLGSGAFLFEEYEGNNPELRIRAGETLVFNLNVIGHPFLIRVSDGGSLYNSGLVHVSTTNVVSTGASAQAQVTGTLYWTVPTELAGNTYVYQCQNHSIMVGDIVIDSAYGNANFNQTITDYGNLETANVINLVGPAVDQIYATVNNTTAAVSVANNIADFTSFALAFA